MNKKEQYDLAVKETMRLLNGRLRWATAVNGEKILQCLDIVGNELKWVDIPDRDENCAIIRYQ